VLSGSEYMPQGGAGHAERIPERRIRARASRGAPCRRFPAARPPSRRIRPVENERDILSQVGNTPLVRLRRLPAAGSGQVWAKLEGNNPAGSVKDRPALSMILEAERRGDIKPGDTLVEATSGNTGIALAMVAAAKGYRMVLVMPENQTEERKKSMRAFGAELVQVTREEGMEGARDLAKRMVDEGKAYELDQFANEDNPLAHYRGTGPEIWRDTGGKVTHFVATLGTTGTVTGCERFFREAAPHVRVIGVHPAEGAQIPGIRKWPEDYRPAFYAPEKISRIIEVSQGEAEEHARRMAEEEGIFCGISSGGSVCVAARIARENPDGVVVCIICDRGDRYLSTRVFGA